MGHYEMRIEALASPSPKIRLTGPSIFGSGATATGYSAASKWKCKR
jgi:hypothetical protein